MPLRRPETGSFEGKLVEVSISASNLVRLSRFPASEPYWSKGVYRFDDPNSNQSECFGVTYAASSVAAAFAESILHESSRFRNGFFEVPSAELRGRHVVSYRRPGRQRLLLADLTGRALKAIGLNNDISATDDYTIPQLWSRAIHDANKKWDGIRYVSRQRNDCFAYAIFARSGLRVISTVPIASADLDALCDEYNVVEI